MWEESKECEINCHCSGLITDKLKINSGNSASKRRREESITSNFRIKMHPHSLDFNKKSIDTPKRKVLGEIQNNSYLSPTFTIDSPMSIKKSPILSPLLNTPISSSLIKQSTSKITKIFEERTKFKSDKENECISRFMKIDMNEETRDSAYCDNMDSPISRVLQRSKTVKNWTLAKMTSESPECTKQKEPTKAIYGHGDGLNEMDDFETLQDLDAEFECENFDECTKYEIISTDSPDVISRGRTTSNRKIFGRNFEFGAPIAEVEQSTSFNSTNTATRALKFDSTFEFTSPSFKKNVTVKKSLKFTETPKKNRFDSGTSLNSLSSPCSSNSKFVFQSESTTSMESGFLSEVEEPFLDLEDESSSPKLADFGKLLSGAIKDDITTDNFNKRQLFRSFSTNENRVRTALFNDEKKTHKRTETFEDFGSVSKKRKANCDSLIKRTQRPVLKRAYSENSASIMTALARSASNPDLIGDFTLPFVLPFMSGNHSDLKSISCDTLASVLKGNYNETITDFQVIDCRYPYEYAGGHIQGARNLYTPEQILTLINKPLDDRKQDERSIIVFHCEFSLERGPKLSRFLRSSDRAKNKENYPSLYYPEIYLLHEGYSSFYKKYPELCEPEGYIKMLDPIFKSELTSFRKMAPNRKSFMM